MAADRKADGHRVIVEAFRRGLIALEDLGSPVHWNRIVCDDWPVNRVVAVRFFFRKHR